ncbi:MAG: tRNA (guanosine(46)-N7)-methyltransferase TrmB [Sulfuricella sp.]|nr:tRNA (guanosine(46)-N7)-methyltransferase TrmB [Sulfuricella sp.]MBS4099184.1 tRNA (guanosine(46)-N7)-methyltransferase TrmB [Sulfuricella sp.]
MTDTNDTPHHRAIRSYVLRPGRMSGGQTRALENLLPRFGIPYQETLLDLDVVFGRCAPKILEIGFGMGASTAEIAKAQPENDYLGIEVHPPGVGSLLKLIDEQSLTNLRIVQHDAVEVLDHMIPDGALDGVHIFFPDPWPKKRHHKRRLIQETLVATLCRKLKPGGYLHAATDWQEYAEHILAVLAAEPQLANTAADYAPRPAYRPLTKFEARGIRLGHGVWDIVFKRK